MNDRLRTDRGDRIAFDRFGTGQPVIFISGAGIFRAIDPVTGPTAERLAAMGLSAITYDRLGRGESPAEGRIDLDRELETLAALIAEAGGRSVLCGHSSGCTIALAAAVRGLPVDGLVLFEAPINGFEGGTVAWATEFLRLLDAGELEAALVWYMRDMPAEWLEEARISPMWPEMVAQVESYRPDAESLAWSASAPLPELLGDLRIPLEAMAGSETFPGMPEAAQALAAAVSNGRSSTVAAADHAWDPGAMAAAIERFVRAIHDRVD